MKKKSGGDRLIHSPTNGLKSLQKSLSYILQSVFEPHHAAMGFVRNKSILDNAKIHEGSRFVYNIDLKDFFSSIDQARVWKCLQLRPFYLNKDYSTKTKYLKWETFKKEYLKTDEPVKFHSKKGRLFTNTQFGTIFVAKNFDKEKDKFIIIGNSNIKNRVGESLENTLWLVNRVPRESRLSLANIIATLCCTEIEVERKNEKEEWMNMKRNVLPQGAPTSPVITNIVCQKLDYLLTAVANRFGLKYSRYADDITFSSMHNVYQDNSEFVIELHRIIKEQGFIINDSKTRLQKDGFRKEVTGLVVNEKANVQKRYIKQLRLWLYYWERYGKEKTEKFFLEKYFADKGLSSKGNPDLALVINGKLNYLKMVKGSNCNSYLDLKNRYNLLIGKHELNHNIDDKFRVEVTDRINIELPPNNYQHKINRNFDRIEKNISPPLIHNPKQLVTLLKNFSLNDSALKYTTHSWDSGRDVKMFKNISDFLILARNQYKVFSYQLYELNEHLNGKIYNFLFNDQINKEGWGVNRIKFGWSSPELLEECKQNPNLNPEDMILPQKYQMQIAGKTIQKFKHVIDIFKNEIEIRDENSGLLNLILERHDKFLLSFSPPIISNLENKTFYTDVQWLGKALDLIFENIQSRPQHMDVTYSIKDANEEFFEFEILHAGSYNTGKSIVDEKLTLIKGNFGDICKYLKNLCDWSIESRFKEGSYRINYLTSDPKKPLYQKIDNAEGFKHILIFYK